LGISYYFLYIFTLRNHRENTVSVRRAKNSVLLPTGWYC
jgi:hypothetical protein